MTCDGHTSHTSAGAEDSGPHLACDAKRIRLGVRGVVGRRDVTMTKEKAPDMGPVVDPSELAEIDECLKQISLAEFGYLQAERTLDGRAYGGQVGPLHLSLRHVGDEQNENGTFCTGTATS